MERELVSIIIPTYKGSSVISQCIDSVLQQSYKKFEVIVVDDNGRGAQEQIKTEQQMKKYKLTDNVIYVVHEKNKNGSAARNTGFNYSKGEYLCFLDDDDLYVNNKILSQVERFNNLSTDYGIVYCSIVEKYSKLEERVLKADKEGNLLLPMLLWNVRLCSSNIMIRREVFKNIQGFDETFKRHQDWEFLVRVLDKYKCGAVSEIGVQKILLNRNIPNSAKEVELYGEYFISKSKPIIESLGATSAKQVYSHYYIEWAKGFLWEKDFKTYWKYSQKSQNAILCFLKSFKYCIGRIIRNQQKL